DKACVGSNTKPRTAASFTVGPPFGYHRYSTVRAIIYAYETQVQNPASQQYRGPGSGAGGWDCGRASPVPPLRAVRARAGRQLPERSLWERCEPDGAARAPTQGFAVAAPASARAWRHYGRRR